MSGEHYKPDQLVNPFTVLRKSPTADGDGGFTETEAQVGATHFAFIRPLRGSELPLNDGLAASVLMLFVVYSAIDLRSTDVLLANGVRYNVRAIMPAGDSLYQEVQAESGVVS